MNRNTTILLAILVGLLLAYWYFFTGDRQESPLTATPAADPAEQQFIDLASRLDGIAFDKSIFTDERFKRLTDLTVEIAPETHGRVDPFAPIGR